MKNAIIIKIEGGIVADVYVTEPMHIVIVDHDMIEGGETFEQRLRKSVFLLRSEKCVIPCHIDVLVESLVLDCKRPGDEPGMVAIPPVNAAA
jgi:hypothetical protein